MLTTELRRDFNKNIQICKIDLFQKQKLALHCFSKKNRKSNRKQFPCTLLLAVIFDITTLWCD